MLNGQAIVDEARTWLGTPYHHQGRLKQVGVDCIGVVIGLARDLGISKFDISSYGRIPNGSMMRMLLDSEMTPLKMGEQKAGDIGLFTFDRDPQHVAIFTDIGMLHAYSQVGACVEHGFNEPWPTRLVACFRLKGVN